MIAVTTNGGILEPGQSANYASSRSNIATHQERVRSKSSGRAPRTAGHQHDAWDEAVYRSPLIGTLSFQRAGGLERARAKPLAKTFATISG